MEGTEYYTIKNAKPNVTHPCSKCEVVSLCLYGGDNRVFLEVFMHSAKVPPSKKGTFFGGDGLKSTIMR